MPDHDSQHFDELDAKPLKYPSRSGACQNMRRHAAHDFDAGHGQWWSCPGVKPLSGPGSTCTLCGHRGPVEHECPAVTRRAEHPAPSPCKHGHRHCETCHEGEFL